METPPAALENNDGSDQDQEESDSQEKQHKKVKATVL